ncbi:MAG: NADH-quinone oxidoreductase subunit A [Cytophagales bacterium]
MSSASDYLPILVQLGVAVGFVATTMVATHLIGPNRKSKNKMENFECGIPAEGNARTPFSIKYFLTAILFVLFDVEVIFMYPWAVNFREMLASHGSAIFIEMLIFMVLLLIGFFYVIKRKALDWE